MNTNEHEKKRMYFFVFIRVYSCSFVFHRLVF